MPGKFELKKSANDKFYFTLTAANGEVVLTGLMHEDRAGALAAVEEAKARGAEDAGYERLVAKDDSPFFLLKAGDGRVLGQSQMYSSASARDEGVRSCLANAPGAAVDDQTLA